MSFPFTLVFLKMSLPWFISFCWYAYCYFMSYMLFNYQTVSLREVLEEPDGGLPSVSERTPWVVRNSKPVPCCLQYKEGLLKGIQAHTKETKCSKDIQALIRNGKLSSIAIFSHGSHSGSLPSLCLSSWLPSNSSDLLSQRPNPSPQVCTPYCPELHRTDSSHQFVCNSNNLKILDWAVQLG